MTTNFTNLIEKRHPAKRIIEDGRYCALRSPEFRMILRDEVDVLSARRTALTRRRVNPLRFTASANALIFLSFCILVVLLQIVSGAYHSEFNGYPDEPAHYVTSVMIREYITGLHWLSPMQFAQDYYHHYPKVALGHWPPFFYLVQALWMTLFSASRVSTLLELAFTTALLAYSIFLEARRWFSWNAAVLAGCLAICLPLVQTYSDEEMSETLLVLTCFWSVIYFARYLDSERWQDNLGFALFFSMAVLTKGSGWLLVIVPPLALLLTRKLRLLALPSFWISALVIGGCCLPWQFFTMHLVERGWAAGSSPNASYTLGALGQFLLITVGIIGLALSLLLAIGIVIKVLLPFSRARVESGAAVMFALLIADWVFHSLVPAGVEDRKMIIAVPALILFIFAGGFWVADRLPLAGRLMEHRKSLVAAAAALCFAVQTFAIPREKHYGYMEAARFITSNPELQGVKILVSSETGGEGMLVSEIAMHEPRPKDIVLRGTKALAEADWNASEYRSFFSSPEEVIRYFEQNGVQLAVVDTFRSKRQLLHDELVKQAIQKFGLFHLLAVFPTNSSVVAGQVQVYRFLPAPKP